MLDGEPVGPAHAGMVPRVGGSGGSALGRPRARGDGSPGITEHARIDVSAPRTRGWFPSAVGQLRATPVGPAHAGMVLRSRSGCVPIRRRPRARGDGSFSIADEPCASWSAPRTRGWFFLLRRRRRSCSVGPAHAGMVPRTDPARPGHRRRPRARGDGSFSPRPWDTLRVSAPRTRGWFASPHRRQASLAVGPAHAGMVLLGVVRIIDVVESAPRTRGWFHRHERVGFDPVVGPAHAGMVPHGARPRCVLLSRPRARGDGSPGAMSLRAYGESAPRTRGWFGEHHEHDLGPAVGPAHAGMVRRHSRAGRRSRCRPRARGDGSLLVLGGGRELGSAPRTRGWFPCSR